MAYELWDTMSRNVVGDYDTEEQALKVVRDALALDGRQAVDSLLLAYEDRNGRTETVAAGAALADRAERTGPPVLVSSVSGARNSSATDDDGTEAVPGRANADRHEQP